MSTAEAVETVGTLPGNVAGTITAHHLILTLHDVLSWVGEDGAEGLCPHHYCQPIPQRPEDRRALLDAARSGNPKFFFGSDTAPHVRERKESACGCAGVFSAPVLLPVLVEAFGAGEKCSDEVARALEPFVAEFGARFYGLPLNSGTVTLTRDEWIVPSSCAGIVPFLAGRKLAWKVARH
jgi:dihydroorotase